MMHILLPALLVLFAAPPVNAEIKIATLQKDFADWQAGKPFLGLTEKEIVIQLGKPTSQKPGVWEYWGAVLLIPISLS